jgi:hypothetical protein
MAGYVLNRIPLLARTFNEGVSTEWNATGTTVEGSAIVSRFGDEGSLAVQVSDNDVIYFNKNSSTGLAINNLISTNGTIEVGDSFSVGFWIKSDSALSFTFSVELLLPNQIGVSSPKQQKSENVSITSGEWSFVQLEKRITTPDDEHKYPISFNITILDVVDASTANINISHPIITASLDFVNNPMLLDVYQNLPEFYRNYDSLGTEAPYPWTLARFLEMCIIHQGEMRQILDDAIYSDISQGKNIADATTLSTLVDPLVAPRKNIFWLAQFSGTNIVNPTTGVTPWENLPATWQGIDDLDGIPVTGNDIAPWDVIQDSDPEPAGLDEFLRWQVQYGYYGVNAGSKEAITESVKRVLTETKEVTYTVPSAWNILIETKKSETPDSSLIAIGEPVLGILELMEYTRPLGCVIAHELI